MSGFLGAGKTTIILNLIKSLQAQNNTTTTTTTTTATPAAAAVADEPYRVALLKNEFGDVEIDSQLARETNITVSEMLNGCVCCVLVGQMQNALVEMREKFNPHRIIVETSGSAFPAPIAWQIRDMEPLGFALDAIVTVVDALNFQGYADTSFTAKLQAQYTDLIVLNKAELVSERALDLLVDRVCELNPDTPRVIARNGHVSPELMFGLDSKAATGARTVEDAHHSDHHHQEREVDIITVIRPRDSPPISHTPASLATALASLPKDDIYRIKGMLLLTTGSALDGDSNLAWHLVNHAFGRSTIQPLHQYSSENSVRLTVMGVGLSVHCACTVRKSKLHWE
ncbi:hypothetical protein CAOG_008603 [Capsaspora owczarzaki ATCC 30864]|uniref:CobW/HypB/UreG nucleotide-binding domain-containing protein n=1 Tax=Capsaspora owczarzaki (strain ATCC 30864) TaxID=595528 RepID=A0A0D2X1R3_CAPO3|nr:hypothetical protein CAOG_008603 [Capsaspora owczarzaki ATCC 30864]